MGWESVKSYNSGALGFARLYATLIKLRGRRLEMEKNLNLITIESPEELEEVPGVISHMLGALASEGVNVVEFISCYTDTLLVIRETDTEKAYRLLAALME